MSGNLGYDPDLGELVMTEGWRRTISLRWDPPKARYARVGRVLLEQMVEEINQVRAAKEDLA